MKFSSTEAYTSSSYDIGGYDKTKTKSATKLITYEAVKILV